MKKIRYKNKVFIITLVLVFFFTIVKVLLEMGFGIDILPNIFYWLWIIILVEATLIYKINSKYILYFAFASTIFGAFLSILNVNIAELILRFGFVFWLIGYIFNLLEISRDGESV